MNKIKKRDKLSANIITIGFQLFGFFIGVIFGAGVVILIINIVRILVV
jgi:hypothetical protein